MATIEQQKETAQGSNNEIAVIEAAIYESKDKLSLALPKSGFMDIDQFLLRVMLQIKATPALAKCTTKSVLISVMEAAQLGLDPAIGHAYFVPRGKICKLDPGYRGGLQLAYRSGKIKGVVTEVIYPGEIYTYKNTQHGTILEHTPLPPSLRTSQAVLAAYAIIILHSSGSENSGSGNIVVFKWKEDIDKSMLKSANHDSVYSPWKTSYPAMAKKTALLAALRLTEQHVSSQILPTSVSSYGGETTVHDEINEIIYTPNAQHKDEIISEPLISVPN